MLDKLKKFQLIDAGEWFGVDGVEEAGNNQDRVALLVEDGVTWDLYEEERKIRNLDKNHELIVEGEEEKEVIITDEPAAAPEEDEGDVVLIKMERRNFSFEHKGRSLYKFTRDHPYQLVNADDEQTLINMGGFRSATQNEVKEFYS